MPLRCDVGVQSRSGWRLESLCGDPSYRSEIASENGGVASSAPCWSCNSFAVNDAILPVSMQDDTLLMTRVNTTLGLDLEPRFAADNKSKYNTWDVDQHWKNSVT